MNYGNIMVDAKINNCPVCNQCLSKKLEITNDSVFVYLDDNPKILYEYLFNHASVSILERIGEVLSHSGIYNDSLQSSSSPRSSSLMNALSMSLNYYPAPSHGKQSRKISSYEFEPLAFHPILSLCKDGSQTFLSANSTTDGMMRFQESSKNLSSIPISISPVDFPSALVASSEKDPEVKKSLLSTFEELQESDLMQELVLDIWNDSDLTSLCFKILKNVCILLNADRGSLFMVETNSSVGERCLVSKLFDVTSKSTLSDSLSESSKKTIILPFGVGIVGWVAETGECANISNVYEDPRFSSNVDQKTGFHTRCLICMPIKDGTGEVLAVAQVVNKLSPVTSSSHPASNLKENRHTNDATGDCVFTERDVRVFRAYTSFCGIGLHHAQILWKSQLETKRSQVLLELAMLIFTEQSDVSRLIYTILMHCQSLMTCQRCQILLVDNNSRDVPDHELFSKVFDFTWQDIPLDMERLLKNRHCVNDARFPTNFNLTSHVARTGETINLRDACSDPRFDPYVDSDDPIWKTRSILCMPIKHSDGRVLGVCQLVNKSQNVDVDTSMQLGSASVDGATSTSTWRGFFTRADESLFEAFALFAGLGIANTQMYEQVLRAEAKQQIAFDVLSYHATATQAEASELAKQLIPSARYYRLNNFGFTDFYLSVDDTVKACIRMFSDLNFINSFHIDYHSLCRWLLSVKKNYRAVTYHNWRHAFNVAQTMFAMFKMGGMQSVFSDLECLSIIIACLSHDLDHRGTNNQFQIRTMSPLINLYSTSVLEHHHFDQCIMLLNTKGNDILCNLSHDEYGKAVKMMEQSILATDLSRYFTHLPEFKAVLAAEELHSSLKSIPTILPSASLDSTSENDILAADLWKTVPAKRELLSAMMMTACDVSASTKPWPVQRKTAELVASEFFEQGDLEKQRLNIKPEAFMDREYSHQFPQMQIDFIDTICAPVYQAIFRANPKLKPLLDGCLANRACWDRMAKGEVIDDELMRLPDDDDGGPPYRDRMMLLLTAHPSLPSTNSSLNVSSSKVVPAGPDTTVGGTVVHHTTDETTVHQDTSTFLSS